MASAGSASDHGTDSGTDAEASSAGLAAGATSTMTTEESSPVATPPPSPGISSHTVEPIKLTHTGPKFKLILQGDIQVCRLNHTRTIVSKIMNSRYLRRWESHQISLKEAEIRSKTPSGFMEATIPYSGIEDINIVSRWDAGHKFCLRITVADGSVLLQANSSYLRDRWLHSIQWKRNVNKYTKILRNTRRPEVLLKEIKNMIDMSLLTSILEECVYQFPLDLVSELLQEKADCIDQSAHEQIIVALSPLLENNHPTQEICEFFSKHCKHSPRSQIVIDLFTPVVHRILKHNTDFGTFTRMRTFIQEYMLALNMQNDGLRVVQTFVRSMHGMSSSCPHPRVLHNLVAVALSAVYNAYEDRKVLARDHPNNADSPPDFFEIDERIRCFAAVFEAMAEYEDWRPLFSSLLQPVPFPHDALSDELFTSNLKPTLMYIINDARCEVHQAVLGIRSNKEGWFHLYCPGGIACDDEGDLYAIMLQRLMGCCCRRKRFLLNMTKMISSCMLLSLRENVAAMDVLCAMLEFDIIESSDSKMQIITTLQSTPEGKQMYARLCEQQIALRELQQKGGPRKLVLHSKSTDADLARILSSGSFGNLEYLNLAFTQVTSACASDLIKLPSLKYLNLWSTQFGDTGVQLLSEHLQKLRVLNLCETPVTDKGILCLAAMKDLRDLNLNSTKLTALTFEGLKERLPGLEKCDVRYTDAW